MQSAGGGPGPAHFAAWHRAVLVVLLTLPWLWPFTSGPSANVLPLTASWACLAVALLVARGRLDALLAALPASWLAAALVSAVIGLLQWFGGAPDWPIISRAELAEAYGNLRQRNQFASLTSIGLAVLVWGRLPSPWLAYAGAALLGAANAASASRTGLLEWSAILLVAAWWPGPRAQRLKIVGLGLASYAAAAALLPALLWALQGIHAANVFERVGADLGCSSRRVLWSNVLHLIAQHPFAGWGWGELDFAHYATLYDGPRFCDILDNAHNLPLHLAVELGLPAAAAVTLAAAWLTWRGAPWRERDPVRQMAWSVLLLVALHSLLEYPLWYGPFQLASLGAVLLLWRPPAVPAERWSMAGAVVLLVGLGWMFFVYDTVSQAYKSPEVRRPAMRLDPIRAAGDVPLFADQLKFAELAITELSRANAGRVHELAVQMIHYSPEPAVLEKLVESALLLDRQEDALHHAARFRAAFPQAYRQWLERWNERAPGTPSGANQRLQ